MSILPSSSHRTSASLLILVAGLIQLAGCSRESSSSSKEPAPAPAKAPTVLEMLASNCPVQEFKVNGVRPSAAFGQIYFAHPKSTCLLAVPPNVRYLRYGYGIDDGALTASPKTGGVVFRISIQDRNNNTTLLWSRTLNPVAAPADRGLQTGLLKLNPVDGAHLVFETLPLAGTANNWAYWTRIAMEGDFDPLRALAENKVTDQFNVSGPRSVAPTGNLLFAHPHSVFALPLTDKIQSIQFSYGMLDEALKAAPKPEGVEFRVILEERNGHRKTLWTHVLKPVGVEADRGTHKDTVTLKSADGDRLLFETVAVRTTPNNWAYWSNMSLQWAGN